MQVEDQYKTIKNNHWPINRCSHQYFDKQSSRYYYNLKESFLVFSFKIHEDILLELHKTTNWYKYWNKYSSTGLMGIRFEYQYFNLNPNPQFAVDMKELVKEDNRLEIDKSTYFAKLQVMTDIDKLFKR